MRKEMRTLRAIRQTALPKGTKGIRGHLAVSILAATQAAMLIEIRIPRAIR